VTALRRGKCNSQRSCDCEAGFAGPVCAVKCVHGIHRAAPGKASAQAAMFGFHKAGGWGYVVQLLHSVVGPRELEGATAALNPCNSQMCCPGYKVCCELENATSAFNP
jgi:hypothetical protein